MCSVQFSQLVQPGIDILVLAEHKDFLVAEKGEIDPMIHDTWNSAI